jgi:hypothetical protein
MQGERGSLRDLHRYHREMVQQRPTRLKDEPEEEEEEEEEEEDGEEENNRTKETKKKKERIKLTGIEQLGLADFLVKFWTQAGSLAGGKQMLNILLGSIVISQLSSNHP